MACYIPDGLKPGQRNCEEYRCDRTHTNGRHDGVDWQPGTHRSVLRPYPQALHLSWFCRNLSSRDPLGIRASVGDRSSALRHCSSRQAPRAAPRDLKQGRCSCKPSLGRACRCRTRNSGSGSRKRLGRALEWQDYKGARLQARAVINRMTSLPDQSLLLELASARRNRVALHEYLEGSHEANARQRNPRRGVARRTG
jgi:hypothetical protein